MTKEKKTYYHLTSSDKVVSILRDGLIPQIGEAQKLVEDDMNVVFLCDKESIKYWRILLGIDTLLKVTMDIPVEEFRYPLYTEYMCSEKIPHECISLVGTVGTDAKSMRNLCLNYLCTISSCTTNCANYYCNKSYYNADEYKSLHDFIHKQLVSSISVLKRLDYSTLAKEQIMEYLVSYGNEGEYTFCDTFDMTEERMWNQLIKYPEDDLSDLRRHLYNWIAENLHGCLDVNTGGWLSRR